MLFKLNDLLINLDEVTYITYFEYETEDDSLPKYLINIYTLNTDLDSDTHLITSCGRIEFNEFWAELKTYKSLFYEIDSNILINIKNISSIMYNLESAQITFKNEKLSSKNLFVVLNESTYLDIIKEMSKL